MKRSRISIILLTMMIAVLGTGCAPRVSIPVGQLPQFTPPSPDAISTARTVVEGHLGIDPSQMTQSGPAVARTRKIVDRLTAAAGFGATKVPVYVVDAGEEVNAMAVNGGAILVYQSLLDRVSNEDELATVLAHEVAHMAARHHEDEGEQERAAGVSILSSVLGTAASIAVAVTTGSSAAGDLAGGVTEATTGTIADGAIVKSYSRDMEYEADHVGMMIMAKAGYDPNAALRFWSNASTIFGEDMEGSSFLSTHPSGPERLDALRDALPFAERYRAEARVESPSSSESSKPEKSKQLKRGKAGKKAAAQ